MGEKDVVAFENVQSHFGIVVAQKPAKKLEEASDVGQQLTELVVGTAVELPFQQKGSFTTTISGIFEALFPKYSLYS